MCGQHVQGLISFTFDCWTSDSGHPYISLTGHYIDSPQDKPDAWALKEDQLAFTRLDGHHTGANIASVLLCVLDEYEIRNKVRLLLVSCLRMLSNCM
jgi:hypothetical protein